MTNVTPINHHLRGIADGKDTGQLTSAHRCAIVRIQDLAIDVSLTTEQSVGVNYAGHINSLLVKITPYTHQDAGDYRSTWERQVRLPPNYYREDRSLHLLGEIIVHLESLLPKTGGAA